MTFSHLSGNQANDGKETVIPLDLEEADELWSLEPFELVLLADPDPAKGFYQKQVLRKMAFTPFPAH